MSIFFCAWREDGQHQKKANKSVNNTTEQEGFDLFFMMDLKNKLSDRYNHFFVIKFLPALQIIDTYKKHPFL